MSKAEFERNKPHVNIGTISRFFSVLFFGALLCVAPRTVFASSDNWAQKISDDFSELIGQAKKENLRPILKDLPTIANSPESPVKYAQALIKSFAPRSQNQTKFKSVGFVYSGSLATGFSKFDEVYQAAQRVTQTQAYQQLPANILEPLSTQWENIANMHDRLSNNASDIDSEDGALGDEAQKISRERAALNDRSTQLQNEIDAWNNECGSHPLPPEEYQQCLNRRNNLESVKTQLLNDISQFNSRASAATNQFDAIKKLVSQWVDETKIWANELGQWASDVQTAFSTQERTCTDEQYAELKAKKDVACPADLPACQEGEICDILREKLTNNEACLSTREELDNVCFGGGNPGHQQQRKQIQRTINKCREYIAKNECAED